MKPFNLPDRGTSSRSRPAIIVQDLCTGWGGGGGGGSFNVATFYLNNCQLLPSYLNGS